MSALEAALAAQLDAYGIHAVREYRFAAIATGGIGKGSRQRIADAGLRDWRFDFAIPSAMLAIEAEGGGWTAGRHGRGKGFADDLRKYDAAMRIGWTVYRCDGEMIRTGHAIQTVQILLSKGIDKPES